MIRFGNNKLALLTTTLTRMGWESWIERVDLRRSAPVSKLYPHVRVEDILHVDEGIIMVCTKRLRRKEVFFERF